MRSKAIKNVVLICLMLTVVFAATLLSLNTATGIAEAVFIADDVPMDLQTTIDGMFDRETTSAEYLYNLDGSADYIYVEFNGGGYAVLYRDTYELLELSYIGTPYSGVNATTKKYYGGPSNYYTKNSIGFKDVITDEVVTISESEASDNAVAIRSHFGSADSIYSQHEESTSTLYSTSETDTLNMSAQSVPSYTDLITGLDLDDGTYIENYTYFLSDPFIGANIKGTCGSVATQLLLNYHNYFTDRRILANESLFTATAENPNTCEDPCSMTSKALGSTDTFYNSIVNNLEPDFEGATNAEVATYIRQYLNACDLTESFTASSNVFTTSISTGYVTKQIDKNLPVIVSLQGALGGTKDSDSGHFVVAYGYQDYTYPDNQGTYFGYIVHYGWSRQKVDDGEGGKMPGDNMTNRGIQAWVNSAWCDGVVRLWFDHEHDFTYIGGKYNEKKCQACGYRTHAYETTILSDGGLKINDHQFDLAGEIIIPNSIYGRSITEIGDYAFHYQLDITSIKLPDTLQKIGECSFGVCTGLTNINFPETLNYIGKQAFLFTSALEVGASLEDINELGESAFASSGITSLTLNGSLTNIPEMAFWGCGNIKKVTLPEGITSISANAFALCSALEYLCAPSTLTSVAGTAFNNCTKMTIYTVATSVSSWSITRPIIYGCTMSSGAVSSFTKSASNPLNANAENGINNPIKNGHTFAGWKDADGNVYDDIASAPNGLLTAKWTNNNSSCVAVGTLITLADGTQKAVEELTGNEQLLVWNMLTGAFDVAPILFIDSDPVSMYQIIELSFSDGTTVKVIDEHAFWDYDLNKYVYVREDAEQYIGHWFNKQTTDENGNLISVSVRLDSVNIYTQMTTAWSPVTYGHLCLYVNGMLSMPGATEAFTNIFDVDPETMKYDTAKMEQDISTYGLYTYEEFNALIPVSEAVFNAFNGQYLKVAIGKGHTSLEEIGCLIARYSVFF